MSQGAKPSEGETLRLEWRSPGELADNPRNWRRHPEAQTEGLVAVMAEVGWAGALLYNEETGRLIDGHARKALPEELTESGKMPVLVGRWTEEQEAQILATLDPLAAMAEADDEALAELIGSIDASDDVAVLLSRIAEDNALDIFDEDDPFSGGQDDGDERISQAPEVQKKWQVEPNDWWTLGRHRLYCGDSREVAESFTGDLLLADPPYGIEAVGGDGLVGAPGKIGPRKIGPRKYQQIAGDAKPFDPAWLLDLGERAIIWGGNHFASRLPESMRWLVWDKERPEGVTFGDAELAWTNLDGRTVSIVRWLWHGLARKGAGEGERYHPTQKPVGLMEEILKMFAKGEKWTVLDPYAGSGPVLLACERQGHTCIAGELEPMYCAVILERWSALTGEKPKRADAT